MEALSKNDMDKVKSTIAWYDTSDFILSDWIVVPENRNRIVGIRPTSKQYQEALSRFVLVKKKIAEQTEIFDKEVANLTRIFNQKISKLSKRLAEYEVVIHDGQWAGGSFLDAMFDPADEERIAAYQAECDASFAQLGIPFGEPKEYGPSDGYNPPPRTIENTIEEIGTTLSLLENLFLKNPNATERDRTLALKTHGNLRRYKERLMKQDIETNETENLCLSGEHPTVKFDQ